MYKRLNIHTFKHSKIRTFEHIRAATAANNVTDITNFADVYLGGFASAPTTRNDGSALQIGDLYFHTQFR